jgi:thiol-disulfide isomerase/thioredoxin
MRFIPVIAISVILFNCSSPTTGDLKTGTWRGVIELQNKQLPFTFRVTRDSANGYDVWIQNGNENLLLDEVTFANDSIDFTLHVFDAQLRAAISGDSLNGYFILNYRTDYRLPFKAVFGQTFRFRPVDSTLTSPTPFSGTYQVVFANDKDTTHAIGLIRQQGTYATGSFLTPTGDYRYLEGGVFNDTLWLSTFDGNHAYLFNATLTSDSSISGNYWAGRSFHQTFTGIQNPNASLPDPESLTYLKPGLETLSFSFPDVDGKPVRLTDERFKGKVVVVQIFGTWCPNCMDETKFLTGWHSRNHHRGVEVLGLAFERKADFTYASDRVKKMQAKWQVPYPLLIGGVDDKAKASEALPELNRVVAFPTTIFVGKDGKVKHIHTGFEGPGTGIYHQQFVEQFNERINELLAEDSPFQ